MVFIFWAGFGVTFGVLLMPRFRCWVSFGCFFRYALRLLSSMLRAYYVVVALMVFIVWPVSCSILWLVARFCGYSRLCGSCGFVLLAMSCGFGGCLKRNVSLGSLRFRESCGTDGMDHIVYTFRETAACCTEDDGLLCSFWNPGCCECATMPLCQHLTLAKFSLR